MHALPDREHEHGARPVQHIARGDLFVPFATAHPRRTAPSGDLRMEKIAPNGILTSVLDDPSRGSTSNMYLAPS